MGNHAEKIIERQTKATLKDKTRHFVTTFEGQKTMILPVSKTLMRFFRMELFPFAETICFLSSYMPCSTHFIGNRLLANDILRLAISVLFVSCRGRKPIERHSILELKIIHAIQPGILTFLI